MLTKKTKVIKSRKNILLLLYIIGLVTLLLRTVFIGNLIQVKSLWDNQIDILIGLVELEQRMNNSPEARELERYEKELEKKYGKDINFGFSKLSIVNKDKLAEVIDYRDSLETKILLFWLVSGFIGIAWGIIFVRVETSNKRRNI